MRTSWNVDDTRKLVEDIHGSSQLALIRPVLESLGERQTYASYHYHLYKQVLYSSIDSRLHEKSLLELTLCMHTSEPWHIDHAVSQAAANAMACIQSLHCLIDTFAHTLCYAAGLNIGPKALGERSIAWHTVQRALKGNVKFSLVIERFSEVESHPTVKHLAALVNHSKHRRVLRPSLNVDLQHPQAHFYELEFPAFSHNGTSYAPMNVERLMEDAYAVLSPGIVTSGNLLNEALAKVSETRPSQENL